MEAAHDKSKGQVRGGQPETGRHAAPQTHHDGKPDVLRRVLRLSLQGMGSAAAKLDVHATLGADQCDRRP